MQKRSYSALSWAEERGRWPGKCERSASECEEFVDFITCPCTTTYSTTEQTFGIQSATAQYRASRLDCHSLSFTFTALQASAVQPPAPAAAAAFTCAYRMSVDINLLLRLHLLLFRLRLHLLLLRLLVFLFGGCSEPLEERRRVLREQCTATLPLEPELLD